MVMGYELDVEVQCLSDDTAILSFFGDVTAFADQAIFEAYDRLTAGGISKIILNFTEHDIIGTPGMAILIDLIVKAYERKQSLFMAVPNNHFRKVFSMVGISQYAAVCSSLDEAKRLCD